jgi:hypothetical protein
VNHWRPAAEVLLTIAVAVALWFIKLYLEGM